MLAMTKKVSFARISLACFMVVKSSKDLPWGIVLCEQNETAFEVTGTSFRVATCQAYAKV
jgi:hypothetical protein